LRRSKSLSFGVVAVAVALGVGAAGAAPIIVSTTQTEVTIGGLSCGTQYRVRVKVAGDSEVTTLNPVTKPCPPPQPPPPPPPPAGEVLYRKTGEGAAAVYGTGSLEEPCYPNLPDIYGQTFCQWTKVTQYNPPQCGPVKDSAAPFAGANSIRYDIVEQAGVSRCEIGKHRRFDAYTHDWYHTAFKLEPSWGETNDGGAVVHQLNYQSICAAPLFLSVDDLNDSGYLLVNAGDDDWNGIDGSCHYYSGQPIGGGFAGRPVGWGGPLYVIPPGQLQRNVWHEVRFHVYWTPSNEGVLEAWHRIRGGTWTKTLDIGPVGSGRPRQFNFPTLALGDQNVPLATCAPRNEVTVANINADCHWPSQDKMGQYLASTFSDDNVPSMWGEFCRASSREAAETCLG
jgi:Polysaccharide lyase